jgi:hypothetical protein
VLDAAGHRASVAQEVYVLVSRAVQVDDDPTATVKRLEPPVS